MAVDDSPRDDAPAAIAAALRVLATDAHAVLTRAAAGGPGGHHEAVGELLRRIGDLQRSLDHDRMNGLRNWLDNLQRQALVVQELGELRRSVERLEGGA
jgi:hypothetical protein